MIGLKEFQLKNLSMDQWEQLKTLDFEMKGESWSDESWESSKDDPRYLLYFIFVEQESRPIGFLLFLKSIEEVLLHLLKIVVSKGFRHQGIGSTCLANFNQKIFLEVECENTNAIKLYHKMGFTTLHRARNYYGPGRDGLKMMREKGVETGKEF